MVRFLNWAGTQARWVLIAGCFLALFLPALSSALRPALPALISLVLGLSVARMELTEFWRRMLKPRRMVQSVLVVLVMMPGTAFVLVQVLTLAGFPQSFVNSAILFALAPPISSAAGLCFILGYDARRALELTLIATLMTPVLGPLAIELLAPDLVAPPFVSLAVKLGQMVAGGLLIGIAIRISFGAEKISANKPAFDGVSALCMVLFVIPLFDGVAPLLWKHPLLSAAVFVFASVVNLGMNLACTAITWRSVGRESAGALGLMWGNRTVALYLAALPFDPVFALFVALYQFPMYATPLLFRGKLG